MYIVLLRENREKEFLINLLILLLKNSLGALKFVKIFLHSPREEIFNGFIVVYMVL